MNRYGIKKNNIDSLELVADKMSTTTLTEQSGRSHFENDQNSKVGVIKRGTPTSTCESGNGHFDHNHHNRIWFQKGQRSFAIFRRMAFFAAVGACQP